MTENFRVDRETHLFVEEDFKSHAGLNLHWKLECDALDIEEWKCIARMIMEYQTEPFRAAIGIPRGGVKLGQFLNEYSTQNSDHPYLLVDDVLNSGKTLMYSSSEFLTVPLVKLSTVVLVNRNHNRYPIKADYEGMSLSTTLQEHINVVFGKEEGVYLS